MERDFEKQKNNSKTGSFCWVIDKILSVICLGMSCNECPVYGKLAGEEKNWKTVLGEDDCVKTRYYLETYKRIWNYYLLHKGYYYRRVAEYIKQDVRTNYTQEELEKKLEEITTVEEMQKLLCEVYNVEIADNVKEYTKDW